MKRNINFAERILALLCAFMLVIGVVPGDALPDLFTATVYAADVSFEITVKDADDNPISDAIIYDSDASSQLGTTDVNGKLTLDWPENTGYNLKISKAGYTDAIYTGTSTNQPVEASVNLKYAQIISFSNSTEQKNYSHEDFACQAVVWDSACVSKLSIAYVSTDTSVATIDTSGNITTKSIGTTEIRASAPGDAKHDASNTATYTLVVLPGTDAVFFAETSLNKSYGDADFTNVAEKRENAAGTFTYSSTDNSVATVDEDTGEVKILGTGTVTIKASYTKATIDFYDDCETAYVLTIGKKVVLPVFEKSIVKVEYKDVVPANPLTFGGESSIPADATLAYSVLEDISGIVSGIDSATGTVTLHNDNFGTAKIEVTFSGDNYTTQKAQYNIEHKKLAITLDLGTIEHLYKQSYVVLKNKIDEKLSTKISAYTKLDDAEKTALNAVNYSCIVNEDTEPGGNPYDITATLLETDHAIINGGTIGKVEVTYLSLSGDEYEIPMGWVKSAEIKATTGYTVSLDKLNFSDTITIDTAAEVGSVEFYVKRISDNAVSNKVSTNFGVDVDAPTVKKFTICKMNGSALDSVLNYLKFGIFYNEEIKVLVEAEDINGPSSGVDTITLFVNGVAKDTKQVDSVLNRAEFSITLNEYKGKEVEISAFATDKVGNKPSLPTKVNNSNTENVKPEAYKILLETDPPAVEAKLEAPIYVASGKDWYNKDVQIPLIIKDELSGIRSVEIDMNGISVAKDMENHLIRKNYYEDDSIVKTLTFQLNTSMVKPKKDGSYVLYAKVIDNAGNKKEYKKTVYIDIVAPIITTFEFNCAAPGNQDFDNSPVVSTDYGFFFRKRTEVVISTKDAEPGTNTKSVTYYLKDYDKGTSSEKITVAVNERGQGRLIVEENTRCQIYAVATDNAENTTAEFVTPGAKVVETIAQHNKEKHITLALDSSSAKDSKGVALYNRSVPVTITVEDHFSGIDSIEWSVVAETDTGKNQSQNISGISEVLSSARKQIEDAGWKVEKTDRNLITKVKKNINIVNDSNNIELKVKMKDRSGHTDEKRITLSIDTTQPKIEVNYNNNDVENEKYFAKGRIATVNISERNFSPDATKFDTNGRVGSWSVTNSGTAANNYNDKVWTAQVAFDTDNDYNFDVKTTDLAGHSSKGVNFGDNVAVHEFVVDLTLPVINVVYDNNNAKNDHFYNAIRVATINIEEKNFRSADVIITTSASNSGTAVAQPSVSSWSTSGTRNMATITFSSDADYTFTLTYKDLAGNVADNYPEDRFTVDLTPPELKITGVSDKTAYNKDVVPVVTFTDANFSANDAKFTLTGWNNGGKDAVGKWGNVPNGRVFTFDNFAMEPTVDDVYTLVANVADLAGNETETSIDFSVNRFGSVYVYSGSTQELITKYYTSVASDINLVEINVNSLSTREITYGKDGDIVTLTQDTDYYVEEGNEGKWKSYEYTVLAKNFEDEGAYTLTIVSEDEATNKSSNRTINQKRTQELPIEFAVDKTAPKVIISGIEKGAVYNEKSRKVLVNCEDNMALKNMIITLERKGESPIVTEVSAEDILGGDGTFSYELTGHNGKQKLTVVSEDMAGNISEQSIVDDVLITTNFWIRYINNIWAIVGTVAVVVIIIGFVWMLVYRKRKTSGT